MFHVSPPDLAAGFDLLNEVIEVNRITDALPESPSIFAIFKVNDDTTLGLW